MRAAIFRAFGGEISVEQVSDPVCKPGSVIVKVGATGLCRSDWHGWMGHDPDIVLPHVPGHELSGTIVEIGQGITNFTPGDRVTVPFVGGCGKCHQCMSGNQQVCDHQFQPGFTAWGSFAEYVAIDYADQNLVRLPDTITFETAAALGCRFVTSWRAVVDQGRISNGEWVAVHGCGGVGLSAVMIAVASGARVLAVDIDNERLQWAAELGAEAVLNARECSDVEATVRAITSGGVHLSLDALGSRETCLNSILSLRKRGRHVQVGLMLAGDRQPVVPMDRIIAWELEISGSHGMQAHRYNTMLDMIALGRLQPERLVTRTLSLGEGATELMRMDSFSQMGIMVINKF